MSLSRNEILQAQDFEREEVTVSEWGGTIWIRSMTSRALEEIRIWFLKIAGNAGDSRTVLDRNPDALRDMKVTLVSYCLCDAQGQLLFDDDEGRQILAQKSGIIVDRLADIAMRVNKLSDEAIAEEQRDLQRPFVGSNSSSAVPSGVP